LTPKRLRWSASETHILAKNLSIDVIDGVERLTSTPAVSLFDFAPDRKLFEATPNRLDDACRHRPYGQPPMTGLLGAAAGHCA